MSVCPSASVLVTKRRRVKFEFWLDLNKAEEAALADWLAALKSIRKYLPVLREVLTTIQKLVDCQVHLVAGVLQRWLQSPAPTALPLQEPHQTRPSTPQKDIAIEIKANTSTGNGKQAMENFLSGMARLQGLDPTVYLSKSVTSTPKEIKKLAGSEITLKVPTFDDLDLDLI